MLKHLDTKASPTTPSVPLEATVKAPSTLGQITDVGDRRVPDPSNIAADTGVPSTPIQNVAAGAKIVSPGGGTTEPNRVGPFKGSSGFKVPT